MTFFQHKRTFIVAEISGNHNGSLKRAKKLILSAKNSKADAVKIQSYTPDTITLNSFKKDFLMKHLNKNSPWRKYKNFYSNYKKAYTPFEWHKELFSYSKKINMKIFSSPFDETAVDLLENLKCPIYKVASPEITHIPLLKKIGKTKKPVILSSGVSTINDLILAIQTLRRSGCNKISILKCDSAYPSEKINANLNNIAFLRKKFNLPIGFSDHTLGDTAAIVATSLGANIIEKHFTLDNKKTVDSFFSLGPKDFKNMVVKIRETENLLGDINYKLSKASLKNFIAKRSIYISKDIKKGERINSSNIQVIRPSYGLHPKNYFKVLNKKAKKNLKFGNRLKVSDLYK